VQTELNEYYCGANSQKLNADYLQITKRVKKKLPQIDIEAIEV